MKNRKMLLYKKIMVTVLSSSMLLLPNWSYALPQGGQIVGGSGTIGTPSGELNITGNGGHMAIDWNSFNIGKGETVNFQQLKAVLNYVTGSQRSEIFGNLNEIWGKLDERMFAAVHGSFIVNLKHVHSVSSGMVMLTDGTELGVTRGYRKELTEKHIAFVQGGM